MAWLIGFGKVAIPGPRSGVAWAATTIGPIIGALIGVVFHDQVVRRTLDGVQEPVPKVHHPGSAARAPIVLDEAPRAGDSLPTAAEANGSGRVATDDVVAEQVMDRR